MNCFILKNHQILSITSIKGSTLDACLSHVIPDYPQASKLASNANENNKKRLWKEEKAEESNTGRFLRN